MGCVPCMIDAKEVPMSIQVRSVGCYTGLILLAGILAVVSNAAAIETRSEWDTAYKNCYPNTEPMLNITNANEDGMLSWHGHYWIRAYVVMAETYADTMYLDKAVRLIDFILFNRDDARHARGQLDLQREPYLDAPVYYLNNRDKAAPGWRRYDSWNKRYRNLLVDDAHIVHGIMRFVDLVMSNAQFSSYRAKAEEYIGNVEETVQAHDSSFVYDRFAGIPGSYYYPNTDGSGLYSGAVELNMDATMGAALLLLDKVKGGVPEYRKKAAAILSYFKKHARVTANNAYDWNYHPQKPGLGATASGDEDFNHGHMDLSFFVLAKSLGLGLGADDMTKFTNTLVLNVFKGNGELAWSVDGKEMNADKNYWPVGFDWIELTEYSDRVLDIAREVYNKNYSSFTWARPFLGWAEILHWTKVQRMPKPPQNLRPLFAP